MRADEEGEDVDIEENILVRLPAMIKADGEKRLEFYEGMATMGVTIMS